MAIQAPSRKVNVGLAATGIMTIIAWALQKFAGIVLPAEVALASIGLINYALQYMVPNATPDAPPEQTTNA